MSVQDDISKYESIRSATDQLAESGNYLLWQMVFYHALCLQLCDRFTPMELQPMVAELIARTNERIQERNQPCESSSQPTNSTDCAILPK